MDLAVKKVQEGDTFVYVLDNIDWMGKVYDMRSDAQTLRRLIASHLKIFLMMTLKKI